ncbi:hypothetical protein ZHAS_00017367 [Anopheles sinensis]|uniref:Uncharacterized protein n=1 Tax=Anopheles sinensis TaxID=74873 RepID=A0A084WGB3_ANOSI|nr:hypothetical protein ZHAS_00017367 [Anopheles sinensis]
MGTPEAGSGTKETETDWITFTTLPKKTKTLTDDEVAFLHWVCCGMSDPEATVTIFIRSACRGSVPVSTSAEAQNVFL